MFSLFLDGPQHSYLQQHRHPHTHRGRWFNPDKFLWLLWSLQREPVYDRNGEPCLHFIPKNPTEYISPQYFVILFALMILVLAGAIVAMTQVRTPGQEVR